MPEVHSFAHVSHQDFAKDIQALRAEAESSLGPDDLKHLRKVERWGRVCSALGYATAWVFPNPISAFLISQGSVTRWTMMMHHVGHGGYDKVPGVPSHRTSSVFANGWRRFVDFPDCIDPSAWRFEHNVLHHYHTGENADPDLLERNVVALKVLNLPKWMKYVALFYLAATWKWLYYASSVLRAQGYAAARPTGVGIKEHLSEKFRRFYDPRGDDGKVDLTRVYEPLSGVGLAAMAKSLLPYLLLRFAVIPALFLPLGTTAASYVLLTSLMAEVITNLHTFLIIAPNHCGADLFRFEDAAHGKGEVWLRQVLGSVNYRTGGDLNDFMHGYLNYQIEHHIWPDLPMLRYRQLQPKVKALCAQYDIPYVQESVWKRLRRLLDIAVEGAEMKVGVTRAQAPKVKQGVSDAAPVNAPVTTSEPVSAAY